MDIIEAYNIWNSLRTRYGSIETFQMYRNFVHDRDFDLLLASFLNTYLKEAKILEDNAARYSVTLPNRPAVEIRIDDKVDAFTDRFIYRKIFEDLISEIFALSRAYRTSTTNDSIREVFKDAILGHASQFEVFYKYGKLKGWEADPPAFKPPKPMKKEELSVSEAFHIWDHLNYRYDQLQTNQFYASFAHDESFIVILEIGIKVLKKQIEEFEQMSLEYGVHVPERPPVKMVQRIDPEAMQDQFMYRTLLSGIQESVDLHMRAVLQTVRNDSLREVFIELLKAEMKMYDKFLKYGKAKGWTKIPPMYGEIV